MTLYVPVPLDMRIVRPVAVVAPGSHVDGCAMSFIISFHGWQGVGAYRGASMWTATLGCITLTVCRPCIERILEILQEPTQ